MSITASAIVLSIVFNFSHQYRTCKYGLLVDRYIVTVVTEFKDGRIEEKAKEMDVFSQNKCKPS